MIKSQQAKALKANHSRWRHMIGRCYDPAYDGFRNYGGRGIAICDRWRTSYRAFHEDMGPCPGPGYSIDRIDNDGPYSPENCQWTDAFSQRRKTRRIRLNTEAAKAIRWLAAHGTPRWRLAAAYGVCISLIGFILKGKSWPT